MRSPLVLIILDGWGYSDSTDHNAIRAARTPVWDKLWKNHPKRLISGCGTDVGLPAGNMGNSEVGHLCMGAGRVVRQSMTRINQDIESGDFARNEVLNAALDRAVRTDKAVHLLGLLSPGGVHSHEQHIFELLKLAADKGVGSVYLHAFTDGRDVPPRSALESLRRTEEVAQRTGARIASLSGRYYAMDRDKRWDRIESVYRLLTEGHAQHQASTAEEALQQAYECGENDEFVLPTRLDGYAPIADGDVVIHANFRADRARQLTMALSQEKSEFKGFLTEVKPILGEFVMLTRYADDLSASCAYAPVQIINSLGEWAANHDMRQLRVAETEKYAHVTFFFNGGREKPFHGEDRILIPSPDVATYDLQPEMSAEAVTDAMVAAITGGDYDLIVCNYANGDMVGHTGIWDAAIAAVETLDACLGRIYEAVQQSQAHCLITADHGNVEAMFNPDADQPHTAHTTSPVPLVYIGPHSLAFDDAPAGLADIAPTLLCLAEVPLPADMEGRVLLQQKSERAS